MDITDYTSYNEIRATCGLSVKELSDSELGMELYQNILSLALGEVTLPEVTPGPGPLDTRFLVIDNTAEGSRTTLEQKLYDLTRLFCTYTIALEAIGSLSIKAAKTISDSKATLTRFSPESTYKDVIERITDALRDIKSRIENIVDTDVDSITMSRVLKPTIDVVTGSAYE